MVSVVVVVAAAAAAAGAGRRDLAGDLGETMSAGLASTCGLRTDFLSVRRSIFLGSFKRVERKISGCHDAAGPVAPQAPRAHAATSSTCHAEPAGRSRGSSRGSSGPASCAAACLRMASGAVLNAVSARDRSRCRRGALGPQWSRGFLSNSRGPRNFMRSESHGPRVRFTWGAQRWFPFLAVLCHKGRVAPGHGIAGH